MRKDEFLRGLTEALTGEIPPSSVRENVNYYDGYISQEMAKGRTVDEIVEEIGEPHIIARTIIDAAEAAGEGGEAYNGGMNPGGQETFGKSAGSDTQRTRIHYVDMSKWYWKLLFFVALILVVIAVVGVVGSLLSLLISFAGPILLIYLIYRLIKNMNQ